MQEIQTTNEDKEITVNIGHDDVVTIDKLFGPTGFATLRIRPDLNRGWVIERAWIRNHQFIEWCVIPAQIELEYDEAGKFDNCENCTKEELTELLKQQEEFYFSTRDLINEKIKALK